MAGPSKEQPLPHGAVGRLLERVTGLWALAGGLGLVALMIIESWSVIGRGLGGLSFGAALKLGSIPGDTEIVEVGCAAAIFAFLPYCQLTRGNVFVDFFTARLPLRLRSFLDLLANLLFLALATALAVQTGRGLLDKIHDRDTTTILRIPDAFPYVLMTLSGALLVITVVYTVCRSAAEIRDNRLIGPQPSGGH